MNFLNKVFGKDKNKRIDKPQQSIQQVLSQLKETEEMLLKKQDFLEAKIEREVAIAKKHKLNNRKAAIQALHRKKKCQNQLQHVDGALSTLEKQRDILESANTNSIALSATKSALTALKKAQEHIDSDTIGDIMNTLADEKEKTEDIANAISQPVASFDRDIDDYEIEKELEALEEELLKGSDRDIAKKLPNVPEDRLTEHNSGKHKSKEKSAAVARASKVAS